MSGVDVDKLIHEMNKSKSSGGSTVRYTGPSFLTLLALVFITLKLCGVITWSWWWVLAPLWVPTCIVLCIMLVVLLVVSALTIVDRFRS